MRGLAKCSRRHGSGGRVLHEETGGVSASSVLQRSSSRLYEREEAVPGRRASAEKRLQDEVLFSACVPARVDDLHAGAALVRLQRRRRATSSFAIIRDILRKFLRERERHVARWLLCAVEQHGNVRRRRAEGEVAIRPDEHARLQRKLTQGGAQL